MNGVRCLLINLGGYGPEFSMACPVSYRYPTVLTATTPPTLFTTSADADVEVATVPAGTVR